MRDVEKHALGTTLSRDAGRAPSRPSGTAMISEQRVQRVPGTVRGRLRLLTGAVLLSTIAGSAWTDNPVASEGPSFSAPITNVTVPVGREAILSCVVANLSTYKALRIPAGGSHISRSSGAVLENLCFQCGESIAFCEVIRA
ncbi:uncharacterized protein LOC112552749 [Pogonomyrmex barbatus]|uniref:Uncharacterized protein LOC112552749 n=1 Tax=Pogonomyrmex barbatus TaxID=144034 RepID=A0A8N1S8I8_9HYME|nr:uncharacterized protein LOC112552749 [Pogonomyrmex barbatus]